jgi:tetratricopeptide (TPR) repeat protein
MKRPIHQRILLLLSLTFMVFGARAQYLAEHRPSSSIPVEDLYAAGERAYRAGDRAEAIAYFDQVIAKDPEHINAYLQRGFCHSLLKHYTLAAKDFSAVIQRKPDHTWAYTSRGSAYSKMDLHDLAIADFSKAIELDPANQEAYNNRGWANKAKGDPEAACADWRNSKRLGNDEARIILKNNPCK